MNILSREELVLLNCFNYLNIDDQQKRSLGKVVHDILNYSDFFERATSCNPAGIKQDDWRNILELIHKNKKLCSLKIRAQSLVMGYDTKGLNALCLQDKKTKEAIFVFRGTGSGEWLDNGEAFSQTASPQQLEALEYFERSVRELELQEKGYTIDVTGHSKGGNKAQFITINSDLIHECYSFDGQGFSKEALEFYKDGIQRNSHKITSIAADQDYVHCLGNEIANKKELYQSKYSALQFPYHHCPDAILDTNGGLTARVEKEPWQNTMINHYTRHIMELKPELKKEIFTSFMGLAQMFLGKQPAIKNRIPSFQNANRAISKAGIEFQNWLFNKERTHFTTRQRLLLCAFGMPIIRLASPFIKAGIKLTYFIKYIKFSKLEKSIFGNLNKEIQKGFGGNSKEGLALQKILESSKKDMDKIWKETKENSFTYKLSSDKLIASNITIDRVDKQIKMIEEYKAAVEKKEEIVKKVKESLNNVNQYKKIAEKYEKKVLFRDSFRNKHRVEVDTYLKSQELLASVGIKNKAELDSLEEELNKNRSILKDLNIDKTKLEDVKDSLQKEAAKQSFIEKRDHRETNSVKRNKNYSKGQEKRIQPDR